MQPLVEKVRAYCHKHGLLQPGPVIVGVSGGADSLTLLHILIALKEDFDIQPHAATLDHSIRGPESAADVAFVQDIARRWHIPCTAHRLDVPALAQEWKLGLEAAARRARYEFLLDVARHDAATTIAVGHNQNDQAETVLMHLSRGSGIVGLGGMSPKTPMEEAFIVRPLLDIPRRDIDTYIAELGISPRVDSTNSDLHYTRNLLRHQIMPMLEKLNPQLGEALSQTADLMREDYEALQATLPPLVAIDGRISLERQQFLALTTSQQRWLIRKAAQQLSPDIELSFERTQAALDLIQSHRHGASLQLGSGVGLEITYDQVEFFNEARSTYPMSCPFMAANTNITIDGEGVFALPGSHWKLSVRRISGEASGSAPLTICLCLDDDPNMMLRTRRPGDRFKPAGLDGHSQKLSDTMINMKIVAQWRDYLPLLTVNAEIVFMVAPSEGHPKIRIGQSFDPDQQGKAANWEFRFFSV